MKQLLYLMFFIPAFSLAISNSDLIYLKNLISQDSVDGLQALMYKYRDDLNSDDCEALLRAALESNSPQCINFIRTYLPINNSISVEKEQSHSDTINKPGKENSLENQQNQLSSKTDTVNKPLKKAPLFSIKNAIISLTAAGTLFLSYKLLSFIKNNYLKKKETTNKVIKEDKSITINNKTLIISQGDITHAPVQAIVNAANPQLRAGGGVCGAIFSAAGDALQDLCNQYPLINGIRCAVGSAKITQSSSLQSRGISHIIHAVGPDCRIILNAGEQDTLLTSAYQTSLQLADQNNLTSIAFPFISSAIYAFPKDRAARIALQAIDNYIRNNPNGSLKKIMLILFSNIDYQLFQEQIKSLSV